MTNQFEATCTASALIELHKTEFKYGIWVIAPEGIRYQGYRNTDVEQGADICSFVELYLPRQSFISFECKERFLMGFGFDDFKRSLASASFNDVVMLKVGRNADKLHLLIKDGKSGKNKSQNQQLQVRSRDKINIIADDKYLEFSSQLRMKSKKFEEIIGEYKTAAEDDNDVRIQMYKEKIVFEGISSEKIFNIRPAYGSIYKFSEDVNGQFSNFQLVYPTHHASANKNVWLRFTKQKWLIVEYEVLTEGYLRYYLFPRTFLWYKNIAYGIIDRSH